ncbi:hypothetical protein D3C78_1566520 [compost metagenome]
MFQRHAGRQRKAHAHGGEQAVVEDAVVDQAVFVGRKGGQRNAGAVGRHHLHLFQHFGVFGVARVQLQHHAVLVHGVVHRRHLPLAE